MCSQELLDGSSNYENTAGQKVNSLPAVTDPPLCSLMMSILLTLPCSSVGDTLEESIA